MNATVDRQEGLQLRVDRGFERQRLPIKLEQH